jgi:predicted nucleic acid-binding protein
MSDRKTVLSKFCVYDIFRLMKYKKIYLDVCVFCRPFDAQNILRNRIETDAYFMIIAGAKAGRYEIKISPAHIAEAEDISDASERFELLSLFNKDCSFYKGNETSKIRETAEKFHKSGFGVGDSAHLAYAEYISDIFVTCDDRLIKKCKSLKAYKLPVVDPVEFVILEGLR